MADLLPDTTAARGAILGRVRQALSTARIPSSDAPRPPPTSLESAAPDELCERFVSELEELNVVVHREADADAVRQRVTQLIAGQRLLAWRDEDLPYGLAEVVAQQTVVSPDADKLEKETAEIGLSGVDAAIAETGSLVLLSTPGHVRSASLLPRRHVAVVRADDVIASFGGFLAQNAAAIADLSCVNVITGPSRTADIELTLTLGVHGPAQLDVVIGP